MSLMDQIIERAKTTPQRIVLPEGTEERTLKAADRVLAEGVANLVIIGNLTEIENLARKWNLKNIDKATLIDPEN
ncbi:Phosphate acetyltransferase, partial [termite gut metagenome]